MNSYIHYIFGLSESNIYANKIKCLQGCKGTTAK
jgi:hypothetical protein